MEYPNIIASETTGSKLKLYLTVEIQGLISLSSGVVWFVVDG